jgi:hypothetical protein
VGKRSPILGYNHNVRYRGLVFHVQTEDSGVASPHLFTHLFHHGVIVSTRKLDYDAGSAEESIKSLMQAQHKAVLKDLRRGSFDDKIDSYLGGTPGLLPRGVEETPDRPSEAELAPSTGTVEMLAGPPTEQVLPFVLDELSEPIIVIEEAPAPTRATPPPLPARVTERHRGSAGASAAATGPVAAAPSTLAARANTGAIDTTLKTAVPAFELSEPDLTPEIEIHMVDDGDEAVTRLAPARRRTRDTETQMPLTDQTRPTLSMEADDLGRPALGADELRRSPVTSDGIPGAIRSSSAALPPLPSDSRRLGDRPSTINAATLPPARPISRPASRPAMSSPQVVTRPAATDERQRREPEAAEVYSPAPPSAELPLAPGERPGQYAQHKKVSGRIPLDGLKSERERSGGVPVPAGLGRPQRPGSAPSAKTGAGGTPVPSPPPTPVPREVPRTASHTEPLRGRVPTPARLPVTGRAGTGAGNGVVMTRPAVIVGAPQKNTGTVPRIRKAREDEGRGFGQGLISEKSLDEVILAYLSEDADEK